MEIAQNIRRPFFDEGEPENWAAFEGEWTLYWGKISAGREYTETQKLTVLEGCVSPGLREEIQLITLEGGKVGFTTVWAMLQTRYAQIKALSARKVWYGLKMRNEEKIQRGDLHEFWVKFKAAWRNVRDATQDQARRLFLDRVPRFVSDICIEEEVKLNKRNPRCKLIATPGLTPEGVKASVEQLSGGVRPTDAEKVGEREWILHFSNPGEATAVCLCNGRRITNSNDVLVIERLDRQLSVTEMFSVADGKLAVKSGKWIQRVP